MRVMKFHLGFLLRVASTVVVCSSLITIYCDVFSDPVLQSKLARLNVTKWYHTKAFPPAVPDMGSNHVCLTMGGRLGNHLFQYASIYGIARRHNFTIILTEDDDLVRYFSISSVKIAPGRYVCNKFEKILEKHACCTYDSGLMDLPKNKNYIIGDWLQSWKYFQDVFTEIRHQFMFSLEIRQTAKYIVNNFRLTNVGLATVVGIHIRIGDILHDQFLVEHGYQVATDSYIHSAIDYFLNKYDNVVFIVCSDNIINAEKIIGHREINYYLISMSPIHDMAVLASCDHVIMTVGTFGWWAGFLSNGTVIYYNQPYRVDSPAWRAHNYSDFYLPTWIGLE